MDTWSPLLDSSISIVPQPRAVTEGDLEYTAMGQLPLRSPHERPQPEVSYICSIIRITRTDGVVGTAHECDKNLQYLIELLAPSAGLSTLCLVALKSCSKFRIDPINFLFVTC